MKQVKSIGKFNRLIKSGNVKFFFSSDQQTFYKLSEMSIRPFIEVSRMIESKNVFYKLI